MSPPSETMVYEERPTRSLHKRLEDTLLDALRATRNRHRQVNLVVPTTLERVRACDEALSEQALPLGRFEEAIGTLVSEGLIALEGWNGVGRPPTIYSCQKYQIRVF